MEKQTNAITDRRTFSFALITAANASLNSQMATCSLVMPARSSAMGTALDGAMGKSIGSTAASAVAQMRASTREALQRAADDATRAVEKAKGDGEARLRDVQSRLEDREALVAQLKEAVAAREGEQSENADLLKAKNGEIALLEALVQKAYGDLEEERRELGGQVDELRRDLALCRLENKHGKVTCAFVHDKCIVAPGDVRTKDGRGYTVSLSLIV